MTETEISLFSFAFCGNYECFERNISHLASIAEEENWSYEGGKPNSILRYYIFRTFSRCYEQGKILYSEKDGDKYACFNTGLMTPNGSDIVAIFDENSETESISLPWRLSCFLDVSSRLYTSIFDRTPEIASYITSFEELYFDPDREIIINSQHIFEDNWDRIKSVVPLSRAIVKQLLPGAIEDSRKKVRRNMRLVIPQFYKGRVMFLLPVSFAIEDDVSVTMALAIEPENGKYRANTIFTKEMAYEKARLLMKPESNWLI